MNRRTVYSMIAGVAIIGISIWYFPNHTWTTVSMDGYGDTERGKSIGENTWKSLAGTIIDERVVTYSSSEDARRDFEEELKASEKIIERTRNNRSSGVEERIVKVLGNPETREGAARIIKLRDRSIHYISAGSLEYALAFEESWLKLW